MGQRVEINPTNYELPELEKIYCLLWDYLRQSFWYKKFCEVMNESGIRTNEKKGELFNRVEEIFESIYKSDIKTKFKLNCPPDTRVMRSYWDYFGNVHNDDFKKWWEKKKDLIVKDYIINLKDPKAAEHLFIFEAATRRYRKDNPNIIPTNEEMLSLVTRDYEYIYVAIPLWTLTLRGIGQQIAQIRKKQRKKWPLEYRKTIVAPIMFQGKIELTELQRYLEYYILKTEGKLTEDEIIEKREKEEKEKEIKNNKEVSMARDEIQRIISADKLRAEKIIKNIENGRFPGKYQPDDK